MPRTLRNLNELTAIADNDWVHVNDITDVTDQDKKITRFNLVGTAISGGGAISTGGFTLTVPATGPAVIKNGAPTAGRAVRWLDANKVEDAGFASADVVRKTTSGVLNNVASWSGTDTVKDAGYATSDVARLTGTQTFTSGLILYDTGLISVPKHQGMITGFDTLADDTAMAITDLPTQGMLIFFTGNVASGHGVGIVNYRALSGPFVQITPLSVPAASNVLNGWTGATLTGATGTDGKINFGCNGTSGDIRVENRSGVSVSFRLLRLAA